MIKSIFDTYLKSFQGLSRDIWLLSLITMINRAGSVVFLFLTIYLIKELGFTPIQAGAIMSIYGTGSLAGAFLGGKLTDRFGYYPVMFCTLIGAGCIFLILMWMKTFVIFAITTFCLSLVSDAFRPASMAAIGAYSQLENRTRSVGLVRLAINLGFSLGSGLGGILAAGYGYHLLFIIDGTTCILAGIAFLLLLKNKPHTDIEEESKDTLEGEQKQVLSPYQDRFYIIFILSNVLLGIAFMQVIYTMPIYYVNHFGLEESFYGMMMMFNGLFIAFTEMPIIYYLETRYHKLKVMGIGALLIALSFLLFNLFGFWWGITMFSILLVTVGEIVNFPFSNAVAIDRTVPKNRGEYMGLYTMGWSFVNIIAPSLGMFFMEKFGFSGLWYLATLLGICSFLGLTFLRKVYPHLGGVTIRAT